MSEAVSDPIERVNALQKRILSGEEVDALEMKTVLDELRKGRKTTHESAAVKKAAAIPIDLNKLFEDLAKP